MSEPTVLFKHKKIEYAFTPWENPKKAFKDFCIKHFEIAWAILIVILFIMGSACLATCM